MKSIILLVLIALLGCQQTYVRRDKSPVAPAAQDDATFVQEGTASWYGSRFHGRKTASGRRFDSKKMTAAHRTLPFGTLVQVTNLKNEKTVTVEITDRGPFAKGRVIDVSQAAAKKLGFVSAGVTTVRLEVAND